MRELTPSQKFGAVLKAVVLSPLSIGLWIAAAVASFYIPSSLPFFAAAAIEVALVYRRLNDETFLRRLFSKLQEKDRAESEEEIEAQLESMDFESRQRIRYILQLQKEILREAKAEDVQSYARPEMDRLSRQLPELVDRAVKLALKKQQLAKYLLNIDERALNNYCANLRQRIDATTDSVTKEQYKQALRRREEELATYGALQQAGGRIDSQLESVEASFASWKAKVIRIKTVDVASAASVSQSLHEELEGLSSDIGVLESSVSEAIGSEEQVLLRPGG